MSNQRFFFLGIGLLMLVGCDQSSQKKDNLYAKSEEFFKEIEAPVTVEANAESQPMPAGTVAQSVAGDGTLVEVAVVQPLENAVTEVAQLAQLAPEKPTTQDIQMALTNANLYQGKVDGVMGPKTKQAIKNFQAQNNLKVDGKVGPMTWKSLKSFYSKSEQPLDAQITSAETANFEAKIGN